MTFAIPVVPLPSTVGFRSDCIDAEALSRTIDEAFGVVASEGPDIVKREPAFVGMIFEIGAGEIHGLETMKRIAKPEVQCLEHEFVSIKVKVRMTDVKIVYPWKLDGVLKLSGSLYADTEFIEGDVHYIRSPDEKEPLIFNEFRITEVGPLNARITGASYITWITSYFVTFITNFLRNSVAFLVERQVGRAICDTVNEVDGVRKVVTNIR